MRGEGISWCAGRIPRVPCLSYTGGAGQELLQDFEILQQHASLMNAFWLFGLLVPAGYWLRGLAGMLRGLAAAILACALVPLLSGLQPSPPLEWAGAVGGLLAGNALGAVVRRLARART